MSDASVILWGLAGYLSGSVPYGLLLMKAAGLGDPRTMGSGNIGATNVLRHGTRPIAAATLLLDMLKGFAPVLAAGLWGGDIPALAAAAGALLGHVFPLWLGFRGGKAVATYIGTLGGMHWSLGLAFIAMWLFMAWWKKISSLSALTATALMPIAAWLLGADGKIIWFTIAAGVLIFIRHHTNIRDLLRGEEETIKTRDDP